MKCFFGSAAPDAGTTATQMSDADLLANESVNAACPLATPWLMVHSDPCFLPDAARRHFEAAPSSAKQISGKAARLTCTTTTTRR